MKTKYIIAIIIMLIFVSACQHASDISTGNATAEFGAYYTKIDSGEEFEKFSRTGPHADIVVRGIGKNNGRLVFWRGSSYLPYWEVDNKKWFLKELTERSGDGPKGRPDKVNTYSVARIIESTPKRVIIHWRYLPKFEGTNPHFNATNIPFHRDKIKDKEPEQIVETTNFVDEYFTITPKGKITRTFKPGTEKYADWIDPENVMTQQLELTGKGVMIKKTTKAAKSSSQELVKRNTLREKTVVKPIKWWRFDEGKGDFTKEAISGDICAVEGHKAYWKTGVSGTALAFDGYNSVVRLPAEDAPSITDSVTLEGWVAIGAYPWNWTPVIQQGHEESYYLGIGPHGNVRMAVKAGQKVYRIDSKQQLKRKRWYHVAGTYDKTSGQVRVYIDGEFESEAIAEPIGIAASKSPVQIGKGKRMRPKDPVRASTFEDTFSFDGLIDEVGLYDVAMTPEQIAACHNAFDLSDDIRQNPDLDKRVLPAGLKRRKFGGYYTHLKFYDTWDGMFRFGDHPDVVVEFDKHPTSFVFWRGVCYIPMIVNESGQWYSNEFNETWNRSGGQGCQEPMSDKESFSNHVKIIESTPARTVVQWRYPLVDVLHVTANYDPYTGWGDWSDWYYYIYPDGVAAKLTHLWTDCSSYHEFQEGMVITGPDQHPEQVLETDPALVLTTLEGESREYFWTNGPPKNTNYKDVKIHVVQYKGDYDPFTIIGGNNTRGNVYSGEVTDYSVFPSWNHWPVAQMPSDGRYAKHPDRTAHSSLTHFNGNQQDVWDSDTPYKRQLFLEGMSKKDPAELIKLTKSWAQAPEIKAVSGCDAFGYDQAKREYPLVAENRQMTVNVNANDEHPLVNICFSVRNWGHDDVAKVRIDGAVSSDIRQGTFVDTDGTDTMVIWIELESVTPVEFTISGAKPNKNYTPPSELTELCDPKTWAFWRQKLKPKEPVAVRKPVAQWNETVAFDDTKVRKVKVDQAIRLAKSITWSAWVKTDTDGTVISLLSGNGDKWDRGSMILFLKDEDLVLDIGWVGSAKLEAAGIRDDKWHHVAVTMVPRAVHFYIDGEFKHSAAMIFKSAYLTDQVTFMNVGYPGYKDIPHFAGGIKYAQVYDYAMTDSQIWNLYKGGVPVLDTDLVKNGSFEFGQDSPMFWEAGRN